jgi:HAD superfamily hydrolase (TIGR01509 family)
VQGSRGVLGLPTAVRACLFDLDGVLTETAVLHDAAWTQAFDAFLRERAASTGEVYVAFDPVHDYAGYVDGRPRIEGVRTFLASRGIRLPEGSETDPPEAATVHGLAASKELIVRRLLRERGVQPYPGSVAYLTAARAAGLHRAVVTSSAHGREVLASAGIAGMIEVTVDAAAAAGLRGKPYPDPYLLAARLLSVAPDAAAGLEDAVAGVQAGRAGGFGCVVGVDRGGNHDELLAHGADLVVSDLSELLPGDVPAGGAAGGSAGGAGP